MHINSRSSAKPCAILSVLIGLNLASASLQRLLAIKALLAVKEEDLQGTHRLIELVEQLIEEKGSNK